MSVGGGATAFRFVYCHHEHDEDEPCTTECRHDPKGCHHAVPVSTTTEGKN